MQIGIRLILPLVALAVVGVMAAAADAWTKLPPGWRRRLLTTGVALGLVWTTLAAGACLAARAVLQ